MSTAIDDSLPVSDRVPVNVDGFGGPSALLQKVLDTIPQSVFWKDTDSVYLGCNQRFAQAAGLDSPESIVGLTDFDLPWELDEAEFYRKCDRRIMDKAASELGIVESQVNGVGQQTWIETNKAPLFGCDGQVIGILGAYHDISKLKQAEESLQQANEKLEQRVTERTQQLEDARNLVQQQLKEKEAAMTTLQNMQSQLLDSSRAAGMAEIASGVLHNIGNVLNSVNIASATASNAVKELNVESIQRIATTLTEKQTLKGQQWLGFSGADKLPHLLTCIYESLALHKQTIQEELEALNEHVKLIANIVASQQAHAQHSGVIENVSVSSILESAIALTIPDSAVLRSVRITTDIEDDVDIMIDRQKVMQILSNLIKNGVESYENQADQLPELVLSSRRLPDDFVRLTIRDRGIGMSQETLDKLFCFGFTTKQNGHGFGLHSASNDAIAMGGKLSATSEGPGKGSAFSLDLPINFNDLQKPTSAAETAME